MSLKVAMMFNAVKMGNLTVNAGHVKQPQSEKILKREDKHKWVGEKEAENAFTTKWGMHGRWTNLIMASTM